jgi:hypothetical protein
MTGQSTQWVKPPRTLPDLKQHKHLWRNPRFARPERVPMMALPENGPSHRACCGCRRPEAMVKYHVCLGGGGQRS